MVSSPDRGWLKAGRYTSSMPLAPSVEKPACARLITISLGRVVGTSLKWSFCTRASSSREHRNCAARRGEVRNNSGLELNREGSRFVDDRIVFGDSEKAGIGRMAIQIDVHRTLLRRNVEAFYED
jgi:hypothetical protein